MVGDGLSEMSFVSLLSFLGGTNTCLYGYVQCISTIVCPYYIYNEACLVIHIFPFDTCNIEYERIKHITSEI